MWHSDNICSLSGSLTRYLLDQAVTSKADTNCIPCLKKKNSKSSLPWEALRCFSPDSLQQKKQHNMLCYHLAKFLCLSFSPALWGTTINLHTEGGSASLLDPVVFSTAPLLVCIINTDVETLRNKFCNWKICHVHIRKQPSATFFVHYCVLF